MCGARVSFAALFLLGDVVMPTVDPSVGIHGGGPANIVRLRCHDAERSLREKNMCSGTTSFCVFPALYVSFVTFTFSMTTIEIFAKQHQSVL